MKRKKEADGNCNGPIPRRPTGDETSPSSKFDSLPFDLKMAIVSRMDVSSLMKFRCVSKIWSSIIRSRGFIDSFFSMSSKHFKKPIFYEGFSYLVLRSTTSHIYIDLLRSQQSKSFQKIYLSMTKRYLSAFVHLTKSRASSTDHHRDQLVPHDLLQLSCWPNVVQALVRGHSHAESLILHEEIQSHVHAQNSLVLWVCQATTQDIQFSENNFQKYDPFSHKMEYEPPRDWWGVWKNAAAVAFKNGRLRIEAPVRLRTSVGNGEGAGVSQNVRRVRLLGIGGNKEFRRSYGFLKQRDCFVRIAPQHVHSIASL
ncbi:unnamed protein product [Brassica oleracea var. botrytis]